jgi:RHS repeat-associated protein
MPVAVIYGTGSTEKHYAIQSDHLNTPRRLIQSDGQVAWQWAYSAFGEEKPTIASNRFANTDLNQSFGTTTVPAVTFNLRYPGQYYDQEPNLHYNYHRSYSATVGRYTQADPIGLDGGWNRFGYVGGNPLSFTDPLGQNTVVGGAIVGGSIGGPPGAVAGAIIGGVAGAGILIAIDKFCQPDGKWMCEGPGQYDKVGTQKEVERMGWFTAYGNTEADATYNWKKLVQASAPLGYNARHIRPKSCKKIK